MSGMRLCVRRAYLSRYISWGKNLCVDEGTLLHTYSVWLCAMGRYFGSRCAAMSGHINSIGQDGVRIVFEAFIEQRVFKDLHNRFWTRTAGSPYDGMSRPGTIQAQPPSYSHQAPTTTSLQVQIHNPNQLNSIPLPKRGLYTCPYPPTLPTPVAKQTKY